MQIKKLTNEIKCQWTMRCLLRGFLGAAVLLFANFNTASAADYTVRHDGKVPEATLLKVEEAVKKVLQFQYKRYRLKLHKPFVVTISSSPKFHMFYRFGAPTKLRYSQNQLNFTQRQCNSDGAAAWANARSVHLCLSSNSNTAIDELDEAAGGLEFLLAHEIRHVFQNQAALPDTTNLENANVGPAWLIEGDATDVQLDYKFDGNWNFDWLLDQVRKVKKPLSTFSDYSQFGSDGYIVGHLAAWLLKSRFGQKKIDQYWESLGEGLTREAAFKQSFGLDLHEFSQEFDAIRNDKNALHRWAKR